MTRILRRTADGAVSVEPDPASALVKLPAALAEPGALLWVDFQAEPPESCRRVLEDVFHFHPLAIDDALEESHVPRVDDWDSYLYLVLHAISFDAAAAEPLVTKELDIFVGAGFVVTIHEQAIEPLDHLWASCPRDGRILGKGAARLLYHVVDELVGAHLPVVDAIDEETERIDELILSAPGPKTLPQVLRIKRALLHLRRIIGPQRETLNRLARDDFAVVEASHRVYFRDVYDHLVRLYDITEGLRDLAAGALDTYLSVINNRMNEVMKTFTLITTLFMPISFITGFFGMNFFTASEPPAPWTGRVAFGVICAVIALIPCLMYLWLKRRRWV